eukprot:11259976-Alexandrium_andersonii.AAC.1
MSASLVGSEMCIRDSLSASPERRRREAPASKQRHGAGEPCAAPVRKPSVSYTHLTLPTICSV